MATRAMMIMTQKDSTAIIAVKFLSNFAAISLSVIPSSISGTVEDITIHNAKCFNIYYIYIYPMTPFEFVFITNLYNLYGGMYGYWNIYQDWGHCGVTNDLGSSPQPEGEARRWWASQVVGDITTTEIEVPISTLSDDTHGIRLCNQPVEYMWRHVRLLEYIPRLRSLWCHQRPGKLTTMTEIEVPISVLSWCLKAS